MNTENPVVKTIMGPVLVDGVPCRLAELADGSARVESWVNGAWRPGGCTFKELGSTGTPCPNPETGAPPIRRPSQW